MRDILTQYGFTFEGTCQCDGHHTEKYKKDNYQVRIRVRSKQFKVKKDGYSKTQWIPENRLAEALEKITNELAIA